MEETMTPRRGVEALLTPEQHEFFGRVAATQGLTLEELLRRVVDAEYKRLFYTERTHAKVPSDARFKLLHKNILAIFFTIERQYGAAAFRKIFGGVLEEFASIRTLEQLEDFNRRQPWVIKKW